ncbi:hypothetical protein DITRI_Ditri03aG0131400 [Diplodiscus trichospermus]
MADNSSKKEAWSFHEIIRAILRCLGLETEVQQNPSCPKTADDGKVKSNQPGSQEVATDPPSNTEYSDPPSTVPDPAADPPSTMGDVPGLVGSLSAPTRPGTSSGTGPQIN